MEGGLHILDLALGHQTVFDQTFSVKLQGGLLLANARVHRRIGEHGLVALVMTKSAIAEDVDDNIFVELLAEFGRHFCGMNHGFGIIAVHMENRRFHHQSDVGGVGRRARIRRRCGKADLIVDHDVDRAARAVAFQARQAKAFRHHALARKGSIAVQQHRHGLMAIGIAELVLFGANLAQHHGIDRFKVGWVGGQ